MFITIDEKDKRPIYQQVVDGIKALLANGALVEGNVLPPVRQMAADLGVNLNTIATAYRQLQEEELITVRHGSGATVSSRTARKNKEEFIQPLRTALTQMVLAGLPHTEILNIVTNELSNLMKKQ